MASSSTAQQLQDAENGDISRPKLTRKNTLKRLLTTTTSMQYRDTPEIASSAIEMVPDRVRVKPLLRNFYTVIFGTKLSPLFLATPLAIASHCAHWGHVWTFAFGCLALVPLAERVSFLTEQIAFYTGPTVGGLLNATCGNATELIIAVFALFEGKVDIVKYSLLGSILSNLLLVLGTSLFCGGLKKENKQKYDGTQANVNFLLLFLGLFCHMLPLMLRYTSGTDTLAASPILDLSRINSIVMLVAYFTYLFFQLYTHREIFEAHEVEDVHMPEVAKGAVIGFASAFIWLAAMTCLITLLSEFVVGTIEDASSSWGISVSFLSIILLPIVGNAAEHASAIIFAWRDELDISLGVALGSATQISIFVVPLAVIVAWIGGIRMDLDLNLIETGTLALSIVVTAFALQDGKSHYMKGLSLIFCYVALSVCFFFVISPSEVSHSLTVGSLPSFTGAFSV